MDAIIIFGAEYLFILSVLVISFFFLFSPAPTKKKILLFALISLPLSFVLSLAAREMYENPRPFVVGGFEPLVPHEPDNGFPSDHALLGASIAALISFFDKRYGLMLWTIAALVGLSRVLAGVHHFADIVGSFAIAIISAGIAYATIALWNNKNNRADS